ncbi:MAG: hypothetical protein K9N07_10030 [Candidatus Cloacimonetes bacterium]|nr:hypothetical protein [Candidatus Cloacimonadota bacterium]
MVRIEIVESLFEEIEKRFQKESTKVFDLIESLKDNPLKGKNLGHVGGIVIKELKYKTYRFYFIADGFKIKCFDHNRLMDLLLLFVRMSDKKHQQKTIDDIKLILKTIGPRGL